ncbi:MAG: ROK family protein, partial [Propionibacteriaceae bacterium]|nr:ROK family protein [Propionibacteriaceae bacterium]
AVADAIDQARHSLDHNGLEKAPEIVAVGIGTAGVVDTATSRILSSTETFADWVGTDLGADLRAIPGWALGDIPVIGNNDVDAHALGEAWLGAGAGLGSMVMVAVGTGVGGALVFGGELWTGSRFVAGELGHVPTPGASNLRCACGRLGHLEGLAAGPAMARRYTHETGHRVDGRELFQRAGNGDPTARWVIDEAAAGLGRVLAGLAVAIDPEAIVIGGGVSEAGDLWWRPLRNSFQSEVIDVLADVPLLPATLGGDAPVIGAARAAYSHLLGGLPT